MGHLVVPALVNSLEDPKVREAAADALADFGSAARPAIPALIAGLDDVEFATKAAETLGILAIEPQLVIGPLTVALQSTNHELRPAAARALGLFGAEARPAIPALIETLRDPRDPQAQAAAADVLGELRLEPELVIPALTASLQSTNRWLRNLASLSLKQYNSQPKATPTQTEKIKP
jgi:HEAT repeat protein